MHECLTKFGNIFYNCHVKTKCVLEEIIRTAKTCGDLFWVYKSAWVGTCASYFVHFCTSNSNVKKIFVIDSIRREFFYSVNIFRSDSLLKIFTYSSSSDRQLIFLRYLQTGIASLCSFCASFLLELCIRRSMKGLLFEACIIFKSFNRSACLVWKDRYYKNRKWRVYRLASSFVLFMI